MTKIDITGNRYGRLVVIKECGKRKTNTEWLCKCDCGNFHKATTNSLNMGSVKSCGCLHSEMAVKNGKKATKHGNSHSRLYRIWGNMKTRCCNPNSNCFHSYGGRGIKICDEWIDDFNNFKEWALSNGYKRELSIDRIDTNGNYEPNNCRWVTMQEQQNNRRNNRLVTIDGETHTVTEWARMLNLNPNSVCKRISAYDYDPIKALNTPLRKYRRG